MQLTLLLLPQIRASATSLQLNSLVPNTAPPAVPNVATIRSPPSSPKTWLGADWTCTSTRHMTGNGVGDLGSCARDSYGAGGTSPNGGRREREVEDSRSRLGRRDLAVEG